MEATALAVVADEKTLGLPSGPLSDSEKRDRDNQHHKIKSCSEGIGAALSHVYNNLLFRGDDGNQSWESYVRNELPQWLNEDLSLVQADTRRALYEVRRLIPVEEIPNRLLPERLSHAKELASLIPRRNERLAVTGGSWNPAILDDPDRAQGIAKVWELACRNAEQSKRSNGPTADDVRAAREELRPALEEQGLIRSAPVGQVAATAASVQAARQRTIDVAPAKGGRAERYEDVAHEEQVRRDFRDTMANIRDTKTERTAKVEVDHVREQLDAAEHQRLHELQEEVRGYSSNLIAASKAIHGLLGYLQSLSRIHGTQLLDEMRRTDFMGLVTVSDDMQRLQEMGQELMQAVNLARSSDPPTGINAQTIEV
jgi:hypothetical protein